MTANAPQDTTSTDNDGAARTPVTVLGLGRMGRALAEAFLRAGHPTTVWNRTAAKAEPLAAQGAVIAATPAEAVAAAPLVVVCVADHASVRATLDAAGTALDGRTVANLTSGSSGEARETAAAAARHGATYLGGAVMAVPETVGTAAAMLVFSGPRADYDRHEPVLRSLGAGTSHLGDDHGLVSLNEMAVLSVMWNLLNGFLHGAALLGAAGVGAAAFAPLAKVSAETVADWLPAYAQQIDDGAYPVLDAAIDQQRHTMRELVGESAALGVSTELPALVLALADRASAAGRGGDGYAALIEQFRKPSEG
ncbi:NAD(P)-dependent oxidoreductase [Actinomadura sp. WAC 06369]|uniref:NAD(P)-dependent oxidoreductase n=1 Tax=Actinomadura sp. WAC 06369 TaxID=2203193 RepID=UPI000F7B7761|nr:NAD(P)-binding domain-containing protein [Actinomadura sp. WAC 06369]RSN57720.1 6-phosphogluconate dehydrogenase [Actinomadura sp. WAC 06369]